MESNISIADISSLGIRNTNPVGIRHKGGTMHKRREGSANLVTVCRQYWVKPAHKELPKEAMDEAFQMNRLWNQLVEISEANREAYKAIMESDPEFEILVKKHDALKARADEAHQDLKKARIRYRTKTGEPLKPYIARHKVIDDQTHGASPLL
jgi:hypothetical protein